MKTITKSASIGVIIAGLGTAVALADDSQLQNRLSMQRNQSTEGSRSTTVAVYSNGLGVSQVTQAQSPELRFEMRENAHGQAHYLYVAQ